MKVVVILPTYNEKENILPMLDKLRVVCRSIKGHTFMFLVIDDSSPDGTESVVRKYQRSHRDVLLISGVKEGLGKALLRGMRYAVESLHADMIAQMDADQSHDPAALPSFFHALGSGADFVVGSRYIPGGSIPQNWAPHRKIYSVIGNSIVRFGLGVSRIHDWTGGYRVYAPMYVKALAKQMEQYRGYVFQIAFLYQSVQLGARVAEVPIHFTDRRYGRSKIAPSEYIRNVLVYVAKERMRAIASGSFGKFLVVGTIGFIVNTVVLEFLVRLGYHPVIGSVVGAELAIVSNFLLNNRWTFGSKSIRGKAMIPKFLQFNVTSVGAVIIQSGTIAIGTYLFGIPTYRMFYVLGVGIGLVWNYVMYSRIIWRTHS